MEKAGGRICNLQSLIVSSSSSNQFEGGTLCKYAVLQPCHPRSPDNRPPRDPRFHSTRRVTQTSPKDGAISQLLRTSCLLTSCQDPLLTPSLFSVRPSCRWQPPPSFSEGIYGWELELECPFKSHIHRCFGGARHFICHDAPLDLLFPVPSPSFGAAVPR